MQLSFNEMLNKLRGDKRIPRTLLCLDPGKTTGWCIFTDGELTHWGQLADCFDKQNINAKKIIDFLKNISPDFILYEDYKIYAHKLQKHSYDPVYTVRVIGVIESYIQMTNVLSHRQMALTAKFFCTDDKLKTWGFWKQNQRHARDAIRHGCYFLLFYNKGEDIL